MDLFFEPKSIAVIGATEESRKGGYSLVANLKSKFAERLYPVNPKYDEVCGLPCFRSVRELPEPVDLAVIFIPAPAVPELLRECGQCGIRAVMIQSAGFAETGEQGRVLQDQCKQIAVEYGIRLWGPNCMGVVDGNSGMVASFMNPYIWKDALRPGGVSLIVQSGMLTAGFLIQIISEGYFGLSKACSIGNRSDINECDVLEYLARDPKTEVVAMYLESIIDVPRFRKAVSDLRKPMVLLKGGTSEAGAKAARSHTASLAGNAEVAEAFFRQLGIHRAWDFIELMDLTKALVLWRTKKGGSRIGVITFSGAAGIVAADHLVRRGMTLASLSQDTVQRMKKIYPEWMEPENPVDMWPAIERSGRSKTYEVMLEALIEDPQVDGIHIHFYVDAAIFKSGFDFFRPLENTKKPAVIWVIGDTQFFRPLRDRLEPMGIPVYGEIARGINALSLLIKPGRGYQPS